MELSMQRSMVLQEQSSIATELGQMRNHVQEEG